MSHNIYQAIRDTEFKSKAEQDLMFIMATYGNSKGQNIFPGVTLLAQKLRSTERYTQTLLRKLENDGFIVTTHKKGGRGKLTKYEIVLSRIGIELENNDFVPQNTVIKEVTSVIPYTNGYTPVTPQTPVETLPVPLEEQHAELLRRVEWRRGMAEKHPLAPFYQKQYEAALVALQEFEKENLQNVTT